MTFVSDFQPQQLWRHFDEILTIPRGSKKEEKMRDYVISIAERNSLEYKVDAAGNVVARKPASAGRESAEVTILQAHLDMVNEKNSDVEHDFDSDPIRPQMDGEYLKATGTTLGSDNGIGVATMLAIMDSDDMVHGPLELLFTIDEETGLTGAADLDASLLSGKRLINLDTEEEGALYVGCAGGADSNITLTTESAPVEEGSISLELKLSGLKGGHSGVDIHLQRGNAVKLLARALYAASLDNSFRLATIFGGNLHNAIPREAIATVVAGASVRDAIIAALNSEFSEIEAEFKPAEPQMKLEITDGTSPAEAWTAEATAKVLRLVNLLPHGVMTMSYDIPELVETSTNLATLVDQSSQVVIGLSSRSSAASALTALRQSIRAAGEIANAQVEEGNGYPGWQPDMDSNLLKAFRQVGEKALGHEPEVKAIHAGLECGILGEKCPGMDMISVGPQIEFPHSPDERVHVDSVGRFYDLLTQALDEISAA